MTAPGPRNPAGAENSLAWGMRASTALLAAVAGGLALSAAVPNPPPWSLAAVVAAAVVAVAITHLLRVPLTDLFRGLSNHETLAGHAVAFALFVAVATLARSAPVGLAALTFIRIPTLVSEQGHARWYVLATLTTAFAMPRAPDWATAAAGIVFVVTLPVALAYESRFFALSGARWAAAPAGGPLAPLATAIRRAAVALPAAAAVGWFLPLMDPVAARRPALGDPARRSRAADFPVLEALFYTMILLLMMIAVQVALKWLLRKLRRRSGEPEPESLGVPVGSPVWGMRTEAAQAMAPSTPLGRFVTAYRRFASAAADRGRARGAGETPAEFAEALRHRRTMPPGAVAAVTEAFTAARYGPEGPTASEAATFEETVRDAVDSAG